MNKTKTKYFQTHAEAKLVADALPLFAPSKYLSASEIATGVGKAQVHEFVRGFAVQLGGCGAYYPATHADAGVAAPDEPN